MTNNAGIKIAVNRQREGARDGRRCHDQEVRTRALGAQGIALTDAETMLLIDNNEA